MSLSSAHMTLTNAQVLNLRATPITLVAAPGAGKVLEFVSAFFFYDYGGTVYTESADNLAIKYTDGSGTAASETIETTGFLTASADKASGPIAPAAQSIIATTACDDKPLVLHNTGDGEFGGGNAANVLRVRVTYRVHSAGW